MSSGTRNFLIGLVSCGLAVWIGTKIAHGQFMPAALALGLCVWSLLAWVRGPYAEAWGLSFLIAGYVLGNRGFAQIMPISGLPLFFAEFGLAFGAVVMVLRSALLRHLPLRRDWLNSVLLLWVAVAASRIWLDVRTYGLIAMRDFATVYYVAFFFIAQSVTWHEPSRLLLRRALTVVFAAMPVLVALAYSMPEVVVNGLTMRGVPLIYYKDDLASTFLFAGYLWLLPRQRANPANPLLWLVAIAALVAGLALLSRAASVGLLVGMAWLARAGDWRPARVFAITVAIGVLSVSVYSYLSRNDITQTKIYALYEHAISIIDPAGLRVYRNEESMDSGGNNRFRLTWWRTLAQETWETNPLLGLGFGHDLARSFVQAYDPAMGTEFYARSPHSILFTVFGRMGLIGLASWLAFMFVLFVRTARLHVNEDEEIPRLHAMIWVVLISSVFGVVLEGPMGAVPFWILLGLANHASRPPATGTPS